MTRSRQSPVLADVARLAGVASITVSHVINDHPLVTDRDPSQGPGSHRHARLPQQHGRSNIGGWPIHACSASSAWKPSSTVRPMHLLGIPDSGAGIGTQRCLRHSAPTPASTRYRDGFDRALTRMPRASSSSRQLRKALEALDIIKPTVPFVVTSGTNGEARDRRHRPGPGCTPRHSTLAGPRPRHGPSHHWPEGMARR